MNVYQEPRFAFRNFDIPFGCTLVTVIMFVLWAERLTTAKLWYFAACVSMIWCGVVITWAMFKTTVAVRIYKANLVNSVQAYQLVVRNSARWFLELKRIAIFVGASFLSLFLFVMLNSWNQVPLLCFFSSMILASIVRHAYPPQAIYLSSSNPDRIDLLQKLQRRCAGGVVALLDIPTSIESAMTFREAASRLMVILYDLRTDRMQWKKLIPYLLSCTPMLILDTREDSDGVKFEAKLIVELSLLRKTIFICNQDGSMPAMDKLLTPNEYITIVRLTEGELVSLLPSLSLRAVGIKWEVSSTDR